MRCRFAATLILLGHLSGGLFLPRPATAGGAPGGGARLAPEMLHGKRFRFSWSTQQGSGVNGTATLGRDGTIAGIASPNETSWLIDASGRLVFKHRDGRASTVFTRAEQRGGLWFFAGPFQFRDGVLHVLEELPAKEGDGPDDLVNRMVRPYSRQQIVCLDPGETYRFVLRDRSTRAVRLVAVQEHRDSVISLVRRADVRVEVDGRPLELVCAPYVMPTAAHGIRIQADTTSAWLADLPKRVQFSLWDAADPIVDTGRFGFPLRNYRLFSHGTQGYNEPVHLGAGDGDPAGQRFYHDYGFDLAGYEGGEEVRSVADGEVVKFWPDRENLCGVDVQDAHGFVWGYAHLASAAPEVVLGARLSRGQAIGVLGKTGPSGNFSHLHLGRGTRRVNLYPWLVAAYQAEHPEALLAVARPHQTVRTGETVSLDGSNSLAPVGGRIVEWRWVFDDGRTVPQARADRAFDRPGAYVAALWVKDNLGNEDVDFCQIKVFSRSPAQQAMPHVFMTHTPTQGVRPDQPVRLRVWVQGKGAGPVRVDFDDGTAVTDYESCAILTHRFRTAGIHVVTARTTVGDMPVTTKQKIIVDR